MPGNSYCITCAELLHREIESDLESPGLTTLETLDLLYMRWLDQRLLHKARARARSAGTRRDLTPCQDHYGHRRVA